MHPAIRVTSWGWFWLVWANAGLIVELYWVARNTANTLSRQLWAIEQVNAAHPLDLALWTPAHWAITLMLWAFFAWMSIHIPFYYLR